MVQARECERFIPIKSQLVFDDDPVLNSVVITSRGFDRLQRFSCHSLITYQFSLCKFDIYRTKSRHTANGI